MRVEFDERVLKTDSADFTIANGNATETVPVALSLN